MASNNWLYGCLRCYIQGSSDNVAMVGSYNCSAINTSGVVILNSSGFVADSRHKNWTINQGGRLLKNGWVTLNSSNASALSPYALNGNSGNKYKIDTSLGDVYPLLDAYALNGESVNLKVVDDTNDIVLSTSTNTETIDGNALPYTITPSLYDNYVISSDGSNFWIL